MRQPLLRYGLFSMLLVDKNTFDSSFCDGISKLTGWLGQGGGGVEGKVMWAAVDASKLNVRAVTFTCKANDDH